MRELDALADAGECDGVIADDIAAAKYRETDRTRFASSGRAVPLEHTDIGKLDRSTCGCGFTQGKRRS